MAANTHRNTERLVRRMVVDLVAASCAGILVAPVVTSIDRGIMENASGLASLRASITSSFRALLFQPRSFLLSRPFFLVFALYTGTYASANVLDTALATLHNTPASAVTAGPAKFIATSAANLALCLRKDSAFTRMFGDPRALGRRVPLATYALFTTRDCITVFASFIAAPRIAAHIDADTSALGRVLRRHVDPASAAQFATPAALQIVSTPLHLLGLDLYNRPDGLGIGERLRKIRKDWAMSCVARMCRIIPAFGFGGVVNLEVRRHLMERVQ